jgi:hypothetical protein
MQRTHWLSKTKGKGRTGETVEVCTEGEAVTVWESITVTVLGLAVELCAEVVKIGLNAEGSEDELGVVTLMKAVEGKKIEVNEEGAKEMNGPTPTCKEDEALTTWLFESLEVPAVLAAAELDAPAVPEAGRVSWM